MAVLVAILRDPRREKLLQARQRARREHLGPEGVRLKLLEVRLWRRGSSASINTSIAFDQSLTAK